MSGFHQLHIDLPPSCGGSSTKNAGYGGGATEGGDGGRGGGMG